MNKKKSEEIKIISESPKRRPYASKIAIVLGEGYEFGFDGETCLLIDEKYIITISSSSEMPEKDGKKLQKLIATIEGFATAGHAEEMGLKLSLAILWSGVSKRWPIKLEYHTPQPCMVYDRTQSKSGFFITGRASAHVRSSANGMAELINQIIAKKIHFDPKLLISMELFASARLESTERARFIGLVSSLEPLTSQESYKNQEIEGLAKNFIDQLNNIPSIPENIKTSIVGRAHMLCNESISQAIVRFVKNFFPDNQKVVESVAEAYRIRSDILHHGTFDADLDEKSRELEEIIRYIYSQMLDLQLVTPANF